MSARTLTTETVDEFTTWCASAAGDRALAVTGPAVEQAAYAASDGSAWTVDATDRDLLAASLRAVAASGVRWWAHDATTTATRLHAATRLRLRGLRCTRLLGLTLHPETIGGAPDPGPAGDAVAQATAVAALVATTRRDAPRAQRDLALREMTVDDHWRWVSVRGHRVDVRMLRRELERLDDARVEGVRTHGVDLTGNTDDVRRWLLRRGVSITDPAGRPSLSNDHYATATVPPEAADDWARFVKMREIGSVGSKLIELDRSVTPGGRVHPRINTIGAVTGRMSTEQPSLQNLPGRLRNLLLADEGCTLVGCDLDRVEPCVVAAITQDPALMDAVSGDVYTEMAAQVWGDDARGDAKRRSRAKIVWLSLIYGKGTTGLAADLGVAEDVAAGIQRDLLAAYPVMATWMRETKARAAAGEPLTTLDGRPLPGTAEKAYRAINYVVQGSAADLFKDVTLRVAEVLGRDALWLPVHDELVIQVPWKQAEAAAMSLGDAMTKTLRGVPISGTPYILGDHWGKAEDVSHCRRCCPDAGCQVVHTEDAPTAAVVRPCGRCGGYFDF